jgi:Tfp pilus assembly PilM family ATPase
MSNLDFAKGEAAKLQGDPSLGEAVSRTAVTLIREVRSSINFFEKNSDQAISKVYLTGASIVSPAVVEALSNDIGSPCEAWKATQGLTIQLPPEQQAIFSKNEFAFSTALGVARTYAVAAPVAKTTTAKPTETAAPPPEAPATA